jgi:hypothetical protein
MFSSFQVALMADLLSQTCCIEGGGETIQFAYKSKDCESGNVATYLNPVGANVFNASIGSSETLN